MKNIAILSVFLSLFLFSCSSDDDDVNYLDNSLIAGKWYNVQGNDSTTYIFENNKGSVNVFDRATLAELENISYGPYKITIDAIFFENHPNSGLLYKVDKNTLSIYQNRDKAWVNYTKK